MNIKNANATDIFGVNTELMKQGASEIAIPLQYLLNHVSSVVYPQTLSKMLKLFRKKESLDRCFPSAIILENYSEES